MMSQAARTEDKQTEGAEERIGPRSKGTEGIWEWETYDPQQIKKRTDLPFGTRAMEQMEKEITLVWKRKLGSKRRKPWVAVAEAAVLRGTANEGGMGLYAWKDFEYGEIIGRYTGEKLGPPGGEGEREKLAAGADMLLTLETGPKGADEVIDGSRAGAPYLQRANDAHGLVDERGKQRKNSAWVNPRNGVMKSMRNAGEKKETRQGAKWQAGGGSGGWREAAQREITWAYGMSFWKNKQKAQQEDSERQRRDDRKRGEQGQGAEEERVEEGSERDDARTGGEVQREQTTTTAALMGGMMWEAGDGRLLAKEEGGRGKVMFVTHIWVKKEERRKRWATEAIVREGKRIGAKEIHLIAIDGEARTAYERMGMKAATSKQVDKEHVAWRPDARKGEVYMHGNTATMESKAKEGGCAVSELGGRQMWRKEKCAQTRGRWYEQAYMGAIKDMYKGVTGWRVSKIMPRAHLETACVFMVDGAREGEDTQGRAYTEARIERQRREGQETRERS